jgi:hypothetical protein
MTLNALTEFDECISDALRLPEIIAIEARSSARVWTVSDCLDE